MASYPELDEAKREFARTLDTFLRQGYRGSRRRRPWGNKDFAAAVGVLSVNSVRNWRRPEKLITPDGIYPILFALFGEVEQLATERAALLELWERAKGREPLDESSISASEAETILTSGGQMSDGFHAAHLPTDSREAEPRPSLSDRRFPLFGGGIPPLKLHFLGRTKALEAIRAMLAATGSTGETQSSDDQYSRPARVVVQGMGGIGKTTLAAEFVHKYRKQYPGGVWWCSADDRTTLLTGLADLWAALGGTDASQADIEKAGKLALRYLAEHNSNVLLVYDNVTSPDQIIDLLPAGETHLLVTTRIVEWGGWAGKVALDVLSTVDAVEFLQARAERYDDVGAATLAKVLDHLPLALDHAAGYCAETGASFSDYAERAELLITEVPVGSGYPRSVFVTFNIAISEVVVNHCKAADQLMDYLGQCAPGRIPMTLVRGVLSNDKECTDAVIAVTRFAVVNRELYDDGSPALILHRLVRTVARERTSKNARVEQTIDAIAKRLGETFPVDGGENSKVWSLCMQLSPHAHLICEGYKKRTADISHLRSNLGRYFAARANLIDARKLFLDALADRRFTLGAAHPDSVQSLIDFGVILGRIGELDYARRCLVDALKAVEHVFGPSHPKRALALTVLGDLHHQAGHMDHARGALEMALRVNEEYKHPHDVAFAQTLDKYAQLLIDFGMPMRASTLHRRALEIREAALGSEHPATAESLRNLAGALSPQYDLHGARMLLERALGIQERVLGDDHPDAAKTLSAIANLHCAEGELSHAELLILRALSIQEKILGEDHTDTLISLDNLATIIATQGDHARAKTIFTRVLHARQRNLGPTHPAIGFSFNNLGTVLVDARNFEAAQVHFEQALAIHKFWFGSYHPAVALILSNLGFVAGSTGQLDIARASLREALRIRIEIHPPTHPDVIRSFDDLEQILQMQGDTAAIEALHKHRAYPNDL